jgi:4-diphosphocytidyl-2-C-methyl-D-erythritol kinase
VISAAAPAKLNLALVVGPLRPDGKHEVVSVMAPIELADEIELQPAAELTIEGFPDDTLVRSALEALAAAAGVEPDWQVSIAKRIPVASGLGGGSSDAAAALKLANETLAEPLSASRLHSLAAQLPSSSPPARRWREATERTSSASRSRASSPSSSCSHAA